MQVIFLEIVEVSFLSDAEDDHFFEVEGIGTHLAVKAFGQFVFLFFFNKGFPKVLC
jgi:hypothetical protein